MNFMNHDTTTVTNTSNNGSTPPTTRRLGPETRSAPRRILAGLLAIHGIAHLVGTTDAITAVNDNSSVEYLFGQWNITGTGPLVGVATLWALAAAGFIAVGVTTWIDTRWWPRALVTMAAVSVVLCLVALPQAAIGTVINIALVATAGAVTARRPERFT